QGMDAAVNVGVDLRVVAGEGLDHRLRLLRGRGVVEIDERLAVHLLAEDGKIAPHLLDVESTDRSARNGFAHGSHAASISRSRRAAIKRSRVGRTETMPIRRITSLANPAVRSLRPATSPNPRLFK